MERPLLEVNGVWKRLCRRPENALQYAVGDIAREVLGRSPGPVLRDGEFWALRNVDLEVEAGQVVGVIGHNGAGKSTLINIVSGIMLPTLGSVEIHTNRVALVDQSGGLNPVETGRENAITQLALHGVPDEAIAEEMGAIEAFAEIGDFIDAPVGTYSLGMRLRLAFSIYTRLKPDLFIIDEALGGGDERFRNKFRGFLRTYIDGGGAVLLCSHEMLAIQAFCDQCVLLDRGRVMMSGPPVMMIDSYQELIRERDAEAAARQTVRVAGTDDDGAHEPSAPRCAIESVDILPEDGSEAQPGRAVVIEVAVRVREEIGDVACAIEIGRGEISALATLVVGYPEASFTLRPPRTTLRCRIANLPLAPGNYEVRVAVSLPVSSVTLAMSGYEDAAASFVVAPALNAVSNVVRSRRNLVHMEADWQIVADEAKPTVCDDPSVQVTP